MNPYCSLVLLAALGALSAAAVAAVDTSQWKCESCPFPKGTRGTVDVGVGSVSDESARFGDFTGLNNKGAHLVLGGSLQHRSDAGYYADLDASNLGLDTRSLAATSGREGLYTLRLGYAEIPRHLTQGASTPFLGNGGSVLTLPAGAGFPAGDTAAMPLSRTLRPIDVGFEHKRFDLAGTLIGGERWTWRVSLRRDQRDGTRPTTGSFFATAAQLAAPVDEVTDQLEVSAAYTSRQLQASLAYHISQYSNRHSALTWQNPFLPVVAGATTGQLSLAPDNQFHQLIGSAGYQLTPAIRASADFAYGRMTQNASYLPSTVNASLAGLALPATSLDGQVDSFNGSLRITAAPTDGLRLSATYARDVRDNQTGIRSYSAVDTDLFLDATPRNNTPFSLTQNRLKLAADYRASATLKLSAGAEHDKRHRNYHEAVQTRETSVWARVAAQPREDLSLALKLARADRKHSTYGTSVWFGSPENPLLRKYNLAERQRDSAGVRADLTLSDKVGLGLTIDYANDDYRESLIGLNDGRSVSAGADVSVALSEQTQLHAFVQGENLRSRQSGSQIVGAPDWSGRHQDRFEVLGLAVKHAAIPGKLDIGAELTASRSRSNIEVQTVLGEPPFPSAKTATDRVKLFASWKLRDDLWLNGNLWHERYEAQDWRLDGVLPASVANLLSFGQQAPQYRVTVLSVALRYRF